MGEFVPLPKFPLTPTSKFFQQNHQFTSSLKSLCLLMKLYHKKKKRKFGNFRISTNILVRGGEEDGQGSQPANKMAPNGIPSGYLPFTVLRLVCRANSIQQL